MRPRFFAALAAGLMLLRLGGAAADNASRDSGGAEISRYRTDDDRVRQGWAFVDASRSRQWGAVRTWIAGNRVWRQTPDAPTAIELAGPERAEQLGDSLLVEMGDWRERYRDVIVLAREDFAGTQVLRVRLSPFEGIATTKLLM